MIIDTVATCQDSQLQYIESASINVFFFLRFSPNRLGYKENSDRQEKRERNNLLNSLHRILRPLETQREIRKLQKIGISEPFRKGCPRT